ncbi:hypothetical protein K0M31_001692 [Melipona bicolor]|uniref:Uncharacterized protein n=1 Tax=Melipona bicolor TaxID=60889 RepID=A0AA40GG19_9HYME|nr:hypothetical protein K0M31_001692 [Melipona bicolor]
MPCMMQFLEEQRTRDERNHKLLEALDRVDNDLTLMTAKTDKLNALRVSFSSSFANLNSKIWF